MKWQTRISDGAGTIRGYALKDLVDKLTFTEMIFLILTGRLPKQNERRMLDAMFVASAEHSVAVPSITSARIVASAGNSLNTAVAAGVLAIGEHHGGAVEHAARVFQEKGTAAKIVDAFVARQERVPGYGHKMYTKDPRVEQLFAIAREQKIAGAHVKKALAIDDALCKKTRKELHLNIDGALAALLSDLKVDWRLAKAFFIIPRVVGICAHAYEESVFEPPYRRATDEDCSYLGPARKPLKKS